MSQKLTLTAMFGLSLFAIAQSRDSELASGSSYALALYDPGEAFGVMQELVVLPTGMEALTIPLPFGLGYMAPSPDGKALYAAKFHDSTGSPNTGLYKIEFGPARASRVLGSEGLVSIYGIGASRTKIVVSAGYLNAAGFLDEKSCGIFELMLGMGT